VAGTCANDKGLGTPSDVPTENVAPLWPDAPLSYPPLRNCSGVEAASEDENGSSSSSISGPLSPALLLPGNRGDDRIDDELSRIREVDGGKRVITKFDPVGGTCSITFLVPRGSTVKDVAESARRLLRVPLFYEVRLNEVRSCSQSLIHTHTHKYLRKISRFSSSLFLSSPYTSLSLLVIVCFFMVLLL